MCGYFSHSIYFRNDRSFSNAKCSYNCNCGNFVFDYNIGCGEGALTIRCAKRSPKTELVGINYWGAEWSYAKEQCEQNAEAEGVDDRIYFEKRDAAKLDFKSGTFDAVVNNFVFQEVRSQKNKREVVSEVLRVVKKVGLFVFQDLFEQKQLYGDMEEFIEELRKEGIKEIHYIANVEKQDFIPAFVQVLWMLKGIRLIYGKKGCFLCQNQF